MIVNWIAIEVQFAIQNWNLKFRYFLQFLSISFGRQLQGQKRKGRKNLFEGMWFISTLFSVSSISFYTFSPFKYLQSICRFNKKEGAQNMRMRDITPFRYKNSRKGKRTINFGKKGIILIITPTLQKSWKSSLRKNKMKWKGIKRRKKKENE